MDDSTAKLITWVATSHGRAPFCAWLSCNISCGPATPIIISQAVHTYWPFLAAKINGLITGWSSLPLEPIHSQTEEGLRLPFLLPSDLNETWHCSLLTGLHYLDNKRFYCSNVNAMCLYLKDINWLMIFFLIYPFNYKFKSLENLRSYYM